MLHSQICTIPKCNEKQYLIFSGTVKSATSQTPSSALHLSGLGILDIETQLNSLRRFKGYKIPPIVSGKIS